MRLRLLGHGAAVTSVTLAPHDAIILLRLTAAPDSDSDGFADQIELYIGTSPLDNCPDTATASDEADDKWPPDFTDNQFVDVADVLALKSHYGAVGTSDPKYNKRFDLNVDGNINDLDTATMQPYMLKSCLSPP